MAIVPAAHQKICMGNEEARRGVTPARLLLPGAKDVSASQADRGGEQQHTQRRQQALFEIAGTPHEGSMKDGVERENAEQQRNEFSKLQKHGQISWLPAKMPPVTTPTGFYAVRPTSREPPSCGERATARKAAPRSPNSRIPLYGS